MKTTKIYALLASLGMFCQAAWADPGAKLVVERMQPTPFKTEEKAPHELQGGTVFKWNEPPQGADTARGELRFTVEETGVVYLIGNWGKQGGGGEWTKTALSKEQLVERGWEHLGACEWAKVNGFPGEWFRKVCKQGEMYSIRTNKYWPPEVLVPPRDAAPALPVKKFPVPDEAELERARGVVKEVYGAAQASAKTPESKSALAKRLLKDALNSADDAAAQFVMLRAAMNIASAGGDLETTEQACSATEARFEIAQTRLAPFRAILGVKPTIELSDAATAAAQSAAKVDDYAAAEEFAEIAELSAKKDLDVLKAARAARKQIELLATEFTALQTHQAALQSDALNPAANLAVGRFLCFRKGDWEQGLSYLAVGKGTALGDVAAADLVGASAAPGQMAIGDLWWKYAESDDDVKSSCQARALTWYEKALPALAGLEKARVENRIATGLSARYGHALATTRDIEFLDWQNKSWQNDCRRGFSIRKDKDGYRLSCNFQDGHHSRLIVFPVDAKQKRLHIAFTVVSGSLNVGLRNAGYDEGGYGIERVFKKGEAGVAEIWFDGEPQALVSGTPTKFFGNEVHGDVRYSLFVPRQCELLITELYFR